MDEVDAIWGSKTRLYSLAGDESAGSEGVRPIREHTE